jgi:hypothetical protein
MRRFAAIPILALVLAACANDPVAPAAGGSEPGPDQTRLGIYEALSRELIGVEDLGGGGWKRVVIVTRLCENAGDPAEPKGCEDHLTPAEQDALRQRLSDIDGVEFIEDPTPLYGGDFISGSSHTLVVRLGTISEHGDGVEVGASYGCGGLCGSGTTYLLEEKQSGWEIVGTTGTMWIA